MAKREAVTFEIPSDPRRLTEQLIDQADDARFEYMGALNKLCRAFEDQLSIAQADITLVVRDSMTLVESNGAALFDFAQKLLRARDFKDVVDAQIDFIGKQSQALVDQSKIIGQVMAKLTADAVKA